MPVGFLLVRRNDEALTILREIKPFLVDVNEILHVLELAWVVLDRIPSTTPGAEPPRDAKDSGSARPHSTHLETSSTNRS